MLRVIFDTNVYGLLLDEPDWAEIERKIQQEKDFIVYGYGSIRKEIRSIPTKTRLSKAVRIKLLSMYDRIIGKHVLKHYLKISHLAKKYHDYYRNLGGTYGWDTSIRIDFMIVACASIYGMDIIYSNDEKTMNSKYAIKAYNRINSRENIRTPNFLTYTDLLDKFRPYNL